MILFVTFCLLTSEGPPERVAPTRRQRPRSFNARSFELPGRARTRPGRAGSPDPPDAGDDFAPFLGVIERRRATFAWKCGGLDAANLRAPVGASAMTLDRLRMVRTSAEAA